MLGHSYPHCKSVVEKNYFHSDLMSFAYNVLKVAKLQRPVMIVRLARTRINITFASSLLNANQMLSKRVAFYSTARRLMNNNHSGDNRGNDVGKDGGDRKTIVPNHEALDKELLNLKKRMEIETEVLRKKLRDFITAKKGVPVADSHATDVPGAGTKSSRELLIEEVHEYQKDAGKYKVGYDFTGFRAVDLRVFLDDRKLVINSYKVRAEGEQDAQNKTTVKDVAGEQTALGDDLASVERVVESGDVPSNVINNSISKVEREEELPAEVNLATVRVLFDKTSKFLIVEADLDDPRVDVDQVKEREDAKLRNEAKILKKKIVKKQDTESNDTGAKK